jgi:S1-C subfamily serine protease
MTLGLPVRRSGGAVSSRGARATLALALTLATRAAAQPQGTDSVAAPDDAAPRSSDAAQLAPQIQGSNDLHFDAGADPPTVDRPIPPTWVSPRREGALAARLGRSIVRVQAGDARGVGVFVGGAGRVLTAYAVVDRDAAPLVTLGDGSSVAARVVDWNEPAGIALLELEGPARGEALTLAARAASVGDDVVSPDLVSAPGHDAAEAAPLVAVLGFGQVSGVGAGALWVDTLVAPDDLGRPIVTTQGELLGIVVANADADPAGKQPASGTRARVAAGTVLEPLSTSTASRQDFAPTSHAHWEVLRGLVTVPLASDGLVGAGFQYGYRREWFIALIREGFAVSGFAPRSSLEFERVQRRAFFELELQAQLLVGRTRLFAGAGGVILADNRETRSVDGGGIVSEGSRHTTRVRPLASIGLNTDPLEVGFAVYIGDDIESRLGIGLIWGR